MEGFGDKVRRLRQERRRKDRRFSLRQFADRVGMSPTYLSKVERGELPPPAEDKIRAIAAALDVDAEELMAAAGRVPTDLMDALRNRHGDLWDLVRAASKLPGKEVKRMLRTIEDGEW